MISTPVSAVVAKKSRKTDDPYLKRAQKVAREAGIPYSDEMGEALRVGAIAIGIASITGVQAAAFHVDQAHKTHEAAKRKLDEVKSRPAAV